jgi:hypothetical protein
MEVTVSRGWIGKISALLAGATVALAGCAVGGDGYDGPQGSAHIALEVAPGVIISEVEYEITREGMEPLTGTLPVSEDPVNPISGTISGLLAGTGYTIVLRATANGVECEGSASFNILAGQTTSVTIVLQCRGLDPRGNLDVNGSFNFCPIITAAAVTPSEAAVGDTIAVSASAFDPDGDALDYAWTATSGTFADASAANTAYTCTAAGSHSLTVTVDDGRGCTESLSVGVSCTGEEPPPPDDAGVPAEDAGEPPPPPPVGICGGEPTDPCLSCQCTACPGAMAQCFDAEDVAAAGPAAGTSRGALCAAVVLCGATTGCTGQDCYCGAGVGLIACATGGAQGPCMSEIEAAAETTDPLTIATRQTDTSFALGRANAVGECAEGNCAAQCL